MVEVPAGTFAMGDDSGWAYPDDGEGPVRQVHVAACAIEVGPVTNGAFAGFVAATGHRTTAERAGTSFVFAGLLPADFPDTRAVTAAPWWREVVGADWAHPEGPHSDIAERWAHPVVHVSEHDARAYAAWVGWRLPTEAEWERAARGGTTTTFPWGDELEPGGEHRANVFQGEFPGTDLALDGWAGTSPVGSYPPNGIGLHDVIGNVWEWTASDHVLKGGSYLCHASYCRRYRPAARMSLMPDSTAGNVGFRCAASTD